MRQRFLYIFAFVLLLPVVAHAEAMVETSAKQAIVVDYDTGAVLYAKDADSRMPTSSMSKVMTMYMVFEALQKGHLQLDGALKVSEKAWRKGGSKMFVEVDKEVKIEDLIRGVIVQSGNDATIVLAEGLAGSEDVFAEKMNDKARQLGMNNSNFKNASGWPDPDHYSSARDLATMSKALIKNFPDFYHYYAEQEFKFNNINQRNRNPLLYRNMGADGIKTGHTEAGGYGLIGSGQASDRRVILVVNGLENEKARAQESAKLLQWGLHRFENHKLFAAGDIVEQVNIVMGQTESVSALLQDELFVTIPTAYQKDLKVTANFKEPLLAPVQKGQEIGVLEVNIPYQETITLPLYAAEDVDDLGFLAGGLAKAKMFLSGGS